jgi:hypothetical protein
MRRLFLTLVLASLPAISAAGADDPPTRVTLTLHPVAETVPALKYRLLPSFYERQRGNAAPLYGKAIILLRDMGDKYEQRQQLLDAPLAACTAENVDPLMGGFELIRLASLREHCDWELPVHEQNMVQILLPELLEMRRLSTITALKARKHLAAGNFAAAIDTLRVTYAMARHIGQTPLLINGLVGLSIQDQADKVLLELIQQPGAPNLFWTLTALPTQLVDERNGYEGEMHVLDLTWRRWHELPEHIPDEEDISNFLDDYVEIVQLAALGDEPPLTNVKSAAANLAMLRTAGRRPEVREYVVRSGFSEERLKELTDLQLAMLYTRYKYDELSDMSFRWMSVPYPEAKLGLQAATERLRAVKTSNEELLPLASQLVPALLKSKGQHARARRRIDVMRVIEALRAHATDHEGKLPNTLADLQSAMPIPADALTGKPFDYHAGEGVATLTLPESHWKGKETSLAYEIRIAAKK